MWLSFGILARIGLAVLVAGLRSLVADGSVPRLLGQQACAMRERTGLPCPNCGATRALVALADGRLPEAMVFHPFWTLAALTLLGATLVWFVSPSTVRAAVKNLRFRRTLRPLLWLPLGLWLGLWIIWVVLAMRGSSSPSW